MNRALCIGTKPEAIKMAPRVKDLDRGRIPADTAVYRTARPTDERCPEKLLPETRSLDAHHEARPESEPCHGGRHDGHGRGPGQRKTGLGGPGETPRPPWQEPCPPSTGESGGPHGGGPEDGRPVTLRTGSRSTAPALHARAGHPHADGRLHGLPAGQPGTGAGRRTGVPDRTCPGTHLLVKDRPHRRVNGQGNGSGHRDTGRAA